MVLDDFVFHHAHAGFLYRELGQRDARLVGGGCGREEDCIHLFLRERGKLLLRFAQAGKRAFHGFNAVDRFSYSLLFHTLHLLFFPLGGSRLDSFGRKY